MLWQVYNIISAPEKTICLIQYLIKFFHVTDLRGRSSETNCVGAAFKLYTSL